MEIETKGDVLNKYFEAIVQTNTVVLAAAGLIGVISGAFGNVFWSDRALEKRVSALENKISAKGPPASFWEEQCAKLIIDLASAPDPMKSFQIERAMAAADCKPG